MPNATLKTGDDGIDRWYDDQNRYHNDDGPAITWKDGTKFWYLHGRTHRENGPAIEWADGRKEFRLNGLKVSERSFKHYLKEKKKAVNKYETKTLPSGFIIENKALDIYEKKWCIKGTELLHNEGAPAYIFYNKDGEKCEGWFQQNQYHRLDGPAKVYPGSNAFYIEGEKIDANYWQLVEVYKNKMKKPQYETKTLPSGIIIENRPNQYQKYCWFIKNTNIAHNEGEPALEYTNGTKYWLRQGRFHRLDGPAHEYTTGVKEYRINDKFIYEKDYWNHPDVIAFGKIEQLKHQEKNMKKTAVKKTSSKKEVVAYNQKTDIRFMQDKICRVIRLINEKHGKNVINIDENVPATDFFSSYVDACLIKNQTLFLNDTKECDYPGFDDAALVIHDDMSDMTHIHLQLDQLHCLTGPAVHNDTGESQYWVDGVNLSKEDFYKREDVLQAIKNPTLKVVNAFDKEDFETILEEFGRFGDEFEDNKFFYIEGTRLEHNPDLIWRRGKENYILGEYFPKKALFDKHPWVIEAKNKKNVNDISIKNTIAESMAAPIRKNLEYYDLANKVFGKVTESDTKPVDVITKPIETKQTFVPMIKSDAIDALYRTGANKASEALKSIILSQVKNSSSKELTILKDVLNSPFGDMFCSMLLGIGGNYIPHINENSHVAKIAKECRVNAIAGGMNELVDVITPAILSALKSIPEDKTRVLLPVEENKTETLEEDESLPASKEMYA